MFWYISTVYFLITGRFLSRELAKLLTKSCLSSPWLVGHATCMIQPWIFGTHRGQPKWPKLHVFQPILSFFLWVAWWGKIGQNSKWIKGTGEWRVGSIEVGQYSHIFRHFTVLVWNIDNKRRHFLCIFLTCFPCFDFETPFFSQEWAKRLQ